MRNLLNINELRLESVLFLVSNLFLYAWLDESSMSRSLIQLIFFIGRLVCLIGNYLKYCTWFLASFCLLSIILTWTWLYQVILRTLGFHWWSFIDRVILRLIWYRGYTAFTKCAFIHHEILQLLSHWLSNILWLSFLLRNLCSDEILGKRTSCSSWGRQARRDPSGKYGPLFSTTSRPGKVYDGCSYQRRSSWRNPCTRPVEQAHGRYLRLAYN